jgi:hypothetical protein
MDSHRDLVRVVKRAGNLVAQALLHRHQHDGELFDCIISAASPATRRCSGAPDAARLFAFSASSNIKDLDHVVPFSRRRSPKDLRAAVEELQQLGVLQSRDRPVIYKPFAQAAGTGAAGASVAAVGNKRGMKCWLGLSPRSSVERAGSCSKTGIAPGIAA